MLRLKLDPAKAVPVLISYQFDENADPEGEFVDHVLAAFKAAEFWTPTRTS